MESKPASSGIAVIAVGVVCWLALSSLNAVRAADSTEGASPQAGDKSSASAASPGIEPGSVLRGSASDQAQMQPSIKVLVAPPEAPKPAHLQSSASQTHLQGSAIVTPPKPAPPPPIQRGGDVEGWGNFTPPAPAAAAATVVRPPAPPPPKWNYSITPKNGLMNWDTNYSTKVVPQPPSPRVTAIKETLLRYYLQQKQGQSADHAGLLPFQDMYGRPKFAVNHLPSQQVLVPSQMQAVALPLPGTKAPVAFKPKNWDDWYKHVAQNIYSAWSRAHVTAGSAIVQVTVWPSHDVDAENSRVHTGAGCRT